MNHSNNSGHSMLDWETASVGIGSMLCDAARWDATRQGCNWLGLQANRPGVSNYVESLSPNIYDGAAGIAWFLCQLADVTQLDRFGDVAAAAIRASLIRAHRQLETTLALSTFGGPLGVGVIAIRVGKLLSD